MPPTADSSVSCSEPLHSWVDQSHSHTCLTHSSPDNIFSNLFCNICQAGSYSFSSLPQNNGNNFFSFFSWYLFFCSHFFLKKKKLFKHNMRFPISIYHWIMWHCSIFGSGLFFAIFNNLLALLATAAKAQLSGRVHCSIKILNANLPHPNKWNSKTLSKTFHICMFLWLHSHFYQHTQMQK